MDKASNRFDQEKGQKHGNVGKPKYAQTEILKEH